MAFSEVFLPTYMGADLRVEREKLSVYSLWSSAATFAIRNQTMTDDFEIRKHNSDELATQEYLIKRAVSKLSGWSKTYPVEIRRKAIDDTVRDSKWLVAQSGKTVPEVLSYVEHYMMDLSNLRYNVCACKGERFTNAKYDHITYVAKTAAIKAAEQLVRDGYDFAFVTGTNGSKMSFVAKEMPRPLRARFDRTVGGRYHAYHD